MSKWCDTVCLDRPIAAKEGVVKRKTVNKKLCLDVSTVNIDRPITTTYSRNSNNIGNEEKALNKEECNNTFKSIQPHRLQNPNNIIIGHLNVDSLRNKILAVEELMQKKSRYMSFFCNKIRWNISEAAVSRRSMDISCIEGTETNMESFFISVKMFLVKLWTLKKSPMAAK